MRTVTDGIQVIKKIDVVFFFQNFFVGHSRRFQRLFLILFFLHISDVNYLSSTAPPAAAEWSSLLRPLRGREPEGMWNLLSIVREMFKRHDRNAVPLLEVLTEEIMSCEQVWILFDSIEWVAFI